jgi:hypothetical protein
MVGGAAAMVDANGEWRLRGGQPKGGVDEGPSSVSNSLRFLRSHNKKNALSHILEILARPK